MAVSAVAWPARKWGGHIHIFVFCTINFFSNRFDFKEINFAEHEYMNMPRTGDATGLVFFF